MPTVFSVDYQENMFVWTNATFVHSGDDSVSLNGFNLKYHITDPSFRLTKY